MSGRGWVEVGGNFCIKDWGWVDIIFGWVQVGRGIFWMGVGVWR